MTEGKGLAKTLFCEQQSISSAMKKKELRFGFFPLYLDAVNRCGSFAGGCNSGLRSQIHYAWGAELWAQITAGGAGLELADRSAVVQEDRSGDVVVAGVGKTSADPPTLPVCNDWGKCVMV